MAEVTWSPSGKGDLLNVIARLESISELYARRFASRVDAVVLQLEEFPSIGHPVPELGMKNLRQVVIGNYRFIYWNHNDRVHIIRVWHSARLLKLIHVKP